MNYLLMLAAPAIVSWYYYGALAFRAILTGIISAVAVEAVALLIMKRKLNCLSDMHAGLRASPSLCFCPPPHRFG